MDLHRRGHVVQNRHYYHLRRDVILGSARFGDRLFDSGSQHLWLQLVLGEPQRTTAGWSGCVAELLVRESGAAHRRVPVAPGLCDKRNENLLGQKANQRLRLRVRLRSIPADIRRQMPGP
jgi:hypothetical protein